MNRQRLFRRYLIVSLLLSCLILPQVISAQRDRFGSSTNPDQSSRQPVASPATLASVVSAYITCDNEYVLYYGTATGTTQFIGANACYISTTGPIRDHHKDPPIDGKVAVGGASCIAKVQQYESEIPCGSYAYIAAKSDRMVAQGLLASFQVGSAMISSGDNQWKVFPSNINLGASGSPSSAGFKAALDAQISGATWQPIAVGNQNGTPGPYPLTATGLPSTGSHRWMWYESNNCPGPNSPFRPGCNHGEYLIFRVPLNEPCFKAEVGNICCLGKDIKGNPIYAFTFQVNNPLPNPAAVTLTPPPGVTINSYNPQAIQPGSSVISGTFTWNNPLPPSKLCFVIQLSAKNGTKVSTEVCFKIPCK